MKLHFVLRVRYGITKVKPDTTVTCQIPQYVVLNQCHYDICIVDAVGKRAAISLTAKRCNGMWDLVATCSGLPCLPLAFRLSFRQFMPVPYGHQPAPASPARRAQRSPSPEHVAACGLRYGSQREARRHCARCGWIANRRRWGMVWNGMVGAFEPTTVLRNIASTFEFHLSFHMEGDETLVIPACVRLEWSSAVVRLLDVLCFSDSAGAKRPWIIENPEPLGHWAGCCWCDSWWWVEACQGDIMKHDCGGDIGERAMSDFTFGRFCTSVILKKTWI